MPESLTIPKPFTDLLNGSEFAGPVYDFVTKASAVLSDNKLPFFPNYTDHGVRHVERVLETISSNLIPADVQDLLTDRDAAVILTAALLHDIAMHLRPAGFIQLIRGESELRPVAWFDTPGNRPSVDSNWGDEWAAFLSEVQRFNDRRFADILGRVPDADGLRHWGLEGLPDDTGLWSEYDCLLIGEFLRRHHGRLAHEIALYGFPGLSHDEFPLLSKTLSELANLSGFVARSHAISLREAAEYLRHEHRGDLRPRGVLAVYHMALLRVSDYLQIDAPRAPRLLFKLRTPRVRNSIEEWNKHGAVVHLSFTHEDPSAIKIDLDQKHSLRTHILLSDLISDLQHELDTSCAVLSEVYGPRTVDGLNTIRLNKTRIDSNHSDAALLQALPYIPAEARLDADPRLLSLMIEPLYGFFPEIAIRELIQNAIDAVLERRHHCARRGLTTEELDFAKQDSDVLVDIERQEDGSWILSVVDKGIGMKPETITSFFLRAGASLRESQAWRELFVGQEGRSEVSRSGRFGVGVFSAFLLGNTLEVATRHVDELHGVRFVATRDTEVVELLKTETLVGTSITIRLSNAAVQWIEQHLDGKSWDWFGLADPYVNRQVTVGGQRTTLEQSVVLDPEKMVGERAGWGLIRPDGFGPVVWGSVNYGSLFLNGLAIGGVKKTYNKSHELERWKYSWDDNFPFLKPLLAVSDPEAALPLTLLRDSLSGPLPFEQELKDDILLDFIAFALVSAPRHPIFADTTTRAYSTQYPLLSPNSLRLPWFCSHQGAGPFDRSLIRAMDVKRILISGELVGREPNASAWPAIANGLPAELFCIALPAEALLGRDDMRRQHYQESTKEKDQDETVRQDLIDMVSSLRTAGDGEFELHAARLCARSTQGDSAISFGAGDSFQPDADLDAMLEAWQETSIAVSYDWSTRKRDRDESQRRQQRVPFAGELIVSACDGDSILGKAWLNIVGPTLVPFEEADRRKLIDKIRGDVNMAVRIDKWEQSLRA
jgi:hypothetical protein